MFECVKKEKHVVIKFRDRYFNFNSGEKLKECFENCRKEDIHRIVLDLSSCEIIVSESIGLIFYMIEFFERYGHAVIVLNKPGVLEQLKASKSSELLKNRVFENINTAEDYVAQWMPVGLFRKVNIKGACPKCGNVEIEPYDKGFGKLKRLLKRKKTRNLCRKCGLVWRNK